MGGFVIARRVQHSVNSKPSIASGNEKRNFQELENLAYNLLKLEKSGCNLQNFFNKISGIFQNFHDRFYRYDVKDFETFSAIDLLYPNEHPLSHKPFLPFLQIFSVLQALPLTGPYPPENSYPPRVCLFKHAWEPLNCGSPHFPGSC